MPDQMARNGAEGTMSGTCVRCLLRADIPGVVLDERGLCNHCRAEPRGLSLGDRRAAELVIERARRLDAPLVVALSGGNDSAACLVHLAQSDVACLPVLVDNGFIPEPVRQRAEELCARLGLSLEILSLDLLARLESDPARVCEICISGVLEATGRFAVARGAVGVATGHLYGPAQRIISLGRLGRLPRIAPLYLAGMPEADRTALLDGVGWPVLERFGSSSNCVLLGYIEYRYHGEWGYSPAVGEVSHEVRAGLLAREEATAKLAAAPVWRPEYQDVERTLAKRRL